VKPVRFTKIARREVDQIARYYESQKVGLGAEFYERVDEAVGKIRENSQGYQKIFNQLRRCNIRQFRDYALWFEVRPDKSLIIACLSSRRLPVLAKERGAGVIPFPEP
jgi:hypothetical protein